MEWYLYPLVIAAGFGCGFINTLAGSGSLISLPLLIFLGLPANVANGTNRVAILLQTVVAVDRFRRDKTVDLRRGLLLALPAIAISWALGSMGWRRCATSLAVLVAGVVLVVAPWRGGSGATATQSRIDR